MAAVAALLTSCSKDDTFGGPTRGKVTFEVSTPELATRYGEGTTATNLQYAVYDMVEDATSGKLVDTGKATLNNKTASVSIDLVEGRKYTAIFWADAGENASPYTFTPETKTVSYTDVNALEANQEAYDAFYAFVPQADIKVGQTVNVTLKRPFAQLRIETSDTDRAKQLGVEVEKTGITVNAYTSFNLETGAVDGKQNITFKPTTKASASTTVGEVTYDLISMNYILANPTTADLVDVTLNFTDDVNGTEESYVRKYSNINVQRNYRTIVRGTILTDPTEFDVTVSEGFDGDINEDRNTSETLVVSTADEIINAFGNLNDNDPSNDPGTIVLGDDINLNDLISLRDNSASLSTMTRAGEEQDPSVSIKGNQVLTLDLNGFTLSATESATGSYGLINIQPGAELTIDDSVGTGAIKLIATNNREWNAYSSVISNQRGKLTVNGGTIEHLGGTDMAYAIDNLTNTGDQKAETVINGGTVKSTYRAIRQFLNSTVAENNLTVNGGTIEGENKSIWMQNANASLNPGTLVVEKQAAIKGNVYISYSNAANDYISASVAAEALKDGSEVLLSNAPAGYAVKNIDGVWTVTKAASAAAFLDAVKNVEDGGTITLDSDIIFTEDARTESGNGWYEGLYYSGDKSFTIDLNGHTICQDGAVNDYMFLFKNDGSKANTITIKNGTIDAGTTAFCALCTSTTSTQKITINLENVNVINNKSNGSTIKVRGGAELNVKDGTTITGKDSYLGIESSAATVNIYDGAEIYMNGTSSYNGCLVGVGGNGTINVYGGYGKGVSGGFIAMTSGGTINVSDGEWIANTDGTYANDNKSVLVAQSDKQYNAGAGNAVVNVTGGTFKGGYNCYGNAVGDAQINISGGNFNADPSGYLAEGYIAVEENGGWIVKKQILATTAEMLQTLINGTDDIIYLGADLTLTETVVIPEGKNITLDLNGKTISAVDMNTIKNNGGNLTLKNGNVTRTGDVVGYSVNNASGELVVENVTITRGLYTSGSSLTVTNSNISHEQSSRHAIYSWDCAVTINSGTFHNGNAGNATLMASGSSVVTIKGGTFSIADGRSSLGWTSSMIDQNSTAQVIVKGGLFNGGFRINSADTTLTIEGGEFNTNNGSAFTDYSGTKVVKGGKFTDAGAQDWAKKYIAEGYEMNANGEVVAK